MPSQYPFPRGLLRHHGRDLSRISLFLDSVILTSFQFLIVSSSLKSLFLPWLLLVFCFNGFSLRFSHLSQGFRYSPLLRIFLRVFNQCSFYLLFVYLFYPYFFSDPLSATSAFLLFLSSISYLSLFHLGLRSLLRILRSSGSNYQTVCVSCSPQTFSCLQSAFQHEAWAGYRITSWFSTEATPSNLPDYPYIGNTSALLPWLESPDTDLFIFSDECCSQVGVSSLLKMLSRSNMRSFYFPSWFDPSMSLSSLHINDVNLLEVWSAPPKDTFFIKRICDLVASFLLLIFLSPLLLVVSILVYTTSAGPVLFVQKRSGLDGKVFPCLKFRTMYVLPSPELVQATPGDIRVTPVGRILRRTSVDELPQLLNVLVGQMSLVGPRPHAVEHDQYYQDKVPFYSRRHSTPPGLTGLAQSVGLRGATATPRDMAKRVAADLAYQKNWSIVNDLKILCRTFAFFLFHDSY